jgi:hypothetical protein
MRVVVLCNYDFYNTARDELGTATRTRAGQSRDKVKELKNERSKERLNDANGELSPSRKAVSVNRSSLNRSIERDLMGRLREALGKDEMARAGGHWRQDWVRPHPMLVTSALDEMNCMLKEGREIGNRGAWLEDVLKRWKETKW